MLDKPQSWLSDVLRGRYHDLKWTDGDRLLRLHRSVTRRAQKQADAKDKEAEHA